MSGRSPGPLPSGGPAAAGSAASGTVRVRAAAAVAILRNMGPPRRTTGAAVRRRRWEPSCSCPVPRGRPWRPDANGRACGLAWGWDPRRRPTAGQR
ncbi:hypothetical protein [Ornithinimicrobium kibberense]|uniref:hypothetical protein n=1 Tax=Ornithinimicrobium kibberense TaxID=282060 RepID=UPI00361925B9